MLLKDIPHSEKPRERLLTQSATSLSLIELLAIILKSGNSKHDVLSIAANISALLENENMQVTIQQLKKIPGIGNAKACQLLAVIEFAKRIPQKPRADIPIGNAKDIYHIMKPKIANQSYEEVTALYLSTRMTLIACKTIFTGSLDQVTIHAREIFYHAIKHLAHSIILVHNHPSGDAQPSRADITATTNLIQTGDIIGIPVLDHIIIGGDCYWSYAEERKK